MTTKHVQVSIAGQSVALSIKRTHLGHGMTNYSVLYHGHEVGAMTTYNEGQAGLVEALAGKGTNDVRETCCQDLAQAFDWICCAAIKPLLRKQRFKLNQSVKMTRFDGERVSVTINSPLLRDSQGNLGYYVTGLLRDKTFVSARGMRAF